MKSDGQNEIELSEEEKAEALELLRRADLLHRIGEEIQRAGVAGEKRNGLIIYSSVTSRILPRPMSTLVKGESSAGKNHVLATVKQFFPTDAYKELTGMSRQAMLYSDEPLSHKAILICETHGMDKALYNIRALQSEGRLVFETVQRGAEGQLKTERIEKEGPVAFISTTTALKIHDENETRNWSIYMDESDEQTQAVKDKIADRYLNVDNNDLSFSKTCRNAQRLLKYYPVRIPYARFLSEKTPKKPVRMRRDFERLLGGIEIVTLMHQFQREIKEDNGVRFLEATLEDYFMATKIFETIFEQSLTGANEKTKEIVDTIFALYEGNNKNPVTIKDLMMKLSISRDTVLRRIKPAEESGEIEVEGSKGKHPKTFRPGVKQSHIGLPTVRELAEAFPDLAQNFNAVNPITGKTVTREELINPSSRRAKTEEENAQKVENIETPKPRKVWRCKNGHDSFTSTCPICGEQAYVVPPPGFGRWLGETEAKLFTLERRERDRGDRSMGKM